MSEPLDVSVLQIRNENPPMTKWIGTYVQLRPCDSIPSLMQGIRWTPEREVIRNAMWGLLDSCEVVSSDVPGKDLVMMHSKSTNLMPNKTATTILGIPVFGTVALFKRKSDIECDDFQIRDYEALFPELLPSLDDLAEVANELERDKIIAEFEGNTALGEIVRRTQFMRNKEGAQINSTIEIIRVVTKEAFERLIMPRMLASDPVYWGEFNWKEYRQSYQRAYPYYTAVFNSILGRFDMFSLSHEYEGVLGAAYRLRVPSFDCPEARLWARIADSDVSRKRAIELKRQLGKRLKMDQPLVPYENE
jgi:hypothetical protein